MKKIITWIIVIVVIVAGVFLIVKASKPNATSPQAVFAQCLKTQGLQFFGAFWCPHCQAEKAQFGNAKSFLPYIECSNPDGKSQDQTCNDNKIESYPTWQYPKPITVASATPPTVCDVQPGTAGQPPVCAQEGSTYYKTYLFSDVVILSNDTPVVANGSWTFPAGARTSGVVSEANLAKFSGCTAPAGTN